MSKADLPEIPDKRYFTIGEAATLCAIKPHVVRYWEAEFSQLKPTRRKNRRYYRRQDIEMIRRIRTLLYEQGYTTEGARACLKRRITAPVISEPVQIPIQEELQEILDILAA